MSLNKIYEISDLKSLFVVISTFETRYRCKIKAVSFDIDGTLLDVRMICMVLAESAIEVLGKKGCRLQSGSGRPGALRRALETVGKVRFGRWQDQIEIFQPTLFPGETISQTEGENLVSCYNSAFQRAIWANRFQKSLYSDTIDILAELHDMGVKILIHSGRFTDLSKAQLASVGIVTEEEGGILHRICGGDEGNKIRQIGKHLKLLGLAKATELVVVGDTQDDLDAAIQNGAHAVKIDRPIS